MADARAWMRQKMPCASANCKVSPLTAASPNVRTYTALMQYVAHSAINVRPAHNNRLERIREAFEEMGVTNRHSDKRNRG